MGKGTEGDVGARGRERGIGTDYERREGEEGEIGSCMGEIELYGRVGRERGRSLGGGERERE